MHGLLDAGLRVAACLAKLLPDRQDALRGCSACKTLCAGCCVIGWQFLGMTLIEALLGLHVPLLADSGMSSLNLMSHICICRRETPRKLGAAQALLGFSSHRPLLASSEPSTDGNACWRLH